MSPTPSPIISRRCNGRNDLAGRAATRTLPAASPVVGCRHEPSPPPPPLVLAPHADAAMNQPTCPICGARIDLSDEMRRNLELAAAMADHASQKPHELLCPDCYAQGKSPQRPNDTKTRILAYLTRQRDWYCFNERQMSEAPDFDQAMAELLADRRVERIIVHGRHYFRMKKTRLAPPEYVDARRAGLIERQPETS